MKTKRKISIDRTVGTLAAYALNIFARLLGRLLHRDHTIYPEQIHVIIVSKYLGMGSILQATPLLRALRERFPEAKILFVTALSNRPLMDRLPVINGTLYVDDRSIAA